ncbi:MAG: TlpA disulfide reductase family protein [Tepidisphaeraceae bacterium]
MNRTVLNRTLAAVLCLAAARTLAEPAASGITLHIGDAAPPITVTSWAKGTPVTQFEAGKTYVLEYWATWCVPCKKAMPHLTELSKKYPQVPFIGVDVWEHPREESDAEIRSMVDAFLAKMGDDVGYNIAVDGVAGGMVKGWLDPVGQQFIPVTFVVNGQGKIAWIGHPDLLEPVLTQVLAGTWDTAAERKRVDAANAVEAPRRAAYAAVSAALKVKDYAAAAVACDKAMNDVPDLKTDSNLLSWKLLLLYSTDPAKALDFAHSRVTSAAKPEEALMVVRVVPSVNAKSPMTPADWKAVVDLVDPLVSPGTLTGSSVYADYAALLSRAGEAELALFYQQKAVNLTIAENARRKDDGHADYYTNLLKTRQSRLDAMLAERKN